ncbi:MAG: uridine diphosphate-N-acetylglucosamine-binding protein YvcK [Candidatus Bipolaricaulota bacterium]|nr:uridine diphosphate-N-acetylglucosamine-binding protein YvcK [Candidatus Bipolaricaulota bacterium]
MTIPPVVKLLLPGMGVKRWFFLALAGIALVALGSLFLVGDEGMRGLYALLLRYLPFLWRPAVGAAVLAGGLLATVIGMAGAVRAILHAVTPHRGGSLAEALYQGRILRAAPRVVAVGGGTGLSTLLRGMKAYTANLTAVVTVMDTGGSSGRLREELDVLPPGDVRNCLLALAEDEERMGRFLQYRFTSGEGLVGHSLGNVLLAGMAQAVGGFDRAIEEASYFLSVRGKVVPATLERTNLVAELADGREIVGEAEIARAGAPICRLRLARPVRAYAAALDALHRADLLILGPGSLYTSVISNLLVEGIAEAVDEAPAEKFIVMNLMTEPGETDGFSASDHLRALAEHVNLHRFHAVVVNTEVPPPEILERYRAEGSEPVRDDLRGVKAMGLRVIRAPLLDLVEMEGKLTVKHDPERLARLLARESRVLRRSWTRWFSG